VIEVGHLSGVAHWSKCKILFPRSFVPGPTEYTCQVSSMLAQRSWSLRVLKMLTLHGWMHGRINTWMDI